MNSPSLNGARYIAKAHFLTEMITAVLLLLLRAVPAAAQVPAFEHLNVEDGLSQNSVLAIAQDKEGYMWFGTRFGLNKYDVNRITVFKNNPADSTSLSSSDYIRALYCDLRQTLWIGTSHGLNKYIRSNGTFERILPASSGATGLADAVINAICEDRSGRLWIATKRGLNLLTDRKRNTFRTYLKGDNIHTVVCDSNGTLWMGTSAGLYSLKQDKGRYRLTLYENVSKQILRTDNNSIATMAAGNDGVLWIGCTRSGLIRFSAADLTVKLFKDSETGNGQLSGNNVRKIMIDRHGQLWIGTQKGINVLDPQTGSSVWYRNDPDNDRSLSNNSVYDIYQDQAGSIWIGTYYGGVSVLHPELSPFRTFSRTGYRNSISSNIISGICEDEFHNLWIGTEAEGLNYYDRTTGLFKAYVNQPADPGTLSSNFVKAVYRDSDNRIWVGSHQGGLDLFVPRTGRFLHFRHPGNDTEAPGPNNVNCILEDSGNRFWVGTGQGLNLFDRQSKKFSYFNIGYQTNKNLSETIINCLYEDKSRNIWVGSIGGLYLLKKSAAEFTVFNQRPGDSTSIASNKINCIREDAAGNIWIGTYYGGLSRFVPATGSFVNYSQKDGLPGSNIAGILEERGGVLWLSTDKGLCRFDWRHRTARNYNTNDGLPGNVFNAGSFFKDRQGIMFFGGYNGLVQFDPAHFRLNPYSPAAVFTGLTLFNREVPPGSPNAISEDDQGRKSITLDYSQNVFTIEFSNLNYIKSGNNRYAYRLDGFEKNWNYVPNPAATYTNLREGTYVLRVKGRNNDGLWSRHESLLTVVVRPPFWRTWWAWIFYIAAGASILFIVIRFILMRQLLKKEHEINEMKLSFFTDISHEIRTPLTLIIAPLEKLIAESAENIRLGTQLKLIKENADRLMNLVTELLDFRKAESGHLELKVREHDLIAFARRAFESFAGVAESRNIRYSFRAGENSIPLFFDAAQMDKVLFNLLSNALKFTPQNGTVEVSIARQERSVEISVTDNGAGIPQNKQHRLFSTFYQVNESNGQLGSGVGLALCKSIVELHRGSIEVESRPAKDEQAGYTRFRVILKTGNAHFSPAQLLAEYETPLKNRPEIHPAIIHDMAAQSAGQQEHIKTILLAEDNAEVRKLVRESLVPHYRVVECTNGAEATEAAFSQIPDLVISDIRMPDKDGLTFCQELKTDERTCHIPVILLTARASHEQQVEGLETGADVYVTKPFSPRLLELNIKNLLASREMMKQKYSQLLTLEPTGVIIESPDQKFLARMMNIIEEQIGNPEFSIPLLAREIGMSQPVLYKKVRALTDLSVNDFVKSIRLKRAAALLKQNIFSVSEVAYAVGFSDPKYFTREFRKQFGMAPSDFSKNPPFI